MLLFLSCLLQYGYLITILLRDVLNCECICVAIGCSGSQTQADFYPTGRVAHEHSLALLRFSASKKQSLIKHLMDSCLKCKGEPSGNVMQPCYLTIAKRCRGAVTVLDFAQV